MPQNPIFLPFVSPAKTLKPGQLDYQGDMLVSQAHGTKYWEAYNKNVFFAANQAALASSAGLAPTYLGLCLSNPAASTKNLVVMNVTAALVAVPSAVTFLGLIVGWAAGGITAHTTPSTTLQPSFLGNTTVPQGLVDTACTLVGTPTWNRILGQSPTALIAPYSNMEVNGGIVIPPGGYMALGTSIASPSSGFWGSIEWEEVAV